MADHPTGTRETGPIRAGIAHWVLYSSTEIRHRRMEDFAASLEAVGLV
jgi:hypothetical protein